MQHGFIRLDLSKWGNNLAKSKLKDSCRNVYKRVTERYQTGMLDMTGTPLLQFTPLKLLSIVTIKEMKKESSLLLHTRVSTGLLMKNG